MSSSTPGNHHQPVPPYQQQPPPQAFQPQAPVQTPYQPFPQNQQYGPPQPQYQYQPPQPPQPFRPPPPQPYRNPTYPGPTFNQFPTPGPPQNLYPQNQHPNGPLQFSGPAPQNPTQQYRPSQPPTPFQQSPPPYQPPNANNGNYGSFPPPQNVHQWNGQSQPPHVTQSAPSFQRPQRRYSGSSSYSGTPGFQSQQSQQSQPSQTPQLNQTTSRNGSQSYQQTPQTPASNIVSVQQQPTPKPTQSAAVTLQAESESSSRASTPYGRHDSEIGDILKELKRQAGGLAGRNESSGAGNEDNESEDEKKQFNWEFKYIFKEPPKPESVALAQPLSTNFAMTPVPLLDSRSTASISRYVRKDNLKEFTRSIRSAPQWSFLKEDPAFSDLDLSGPLIPIDELSEWIDERHGTQNNDNDASRKRARSTGGDSGGDNGQEDVDYQIAQEAGTEIYDEEPPNKRQKNETGKQTNIISANGLKTTHVNSPTFGTRDGTPYLATDDEAWAPEPGEGASTPMSPTEMKLAALGVTGAPKPVTQQPMPPYQPPIDEMEYTSHHGPSPTSNMEDAQIPPPPPPPPPPPSHLQGMRNGYNHGQMPPNQFQMPPHPQSSNIPNGMPNNMPANMPGNMQNYGQSNMHQGMPQDMQNRPPQFGQLPNAPYTNGQQHQPQYNPSMNEPQQYGNSGYPTPAFNQFPPLNQYGPPNHQPFFSGPQPADDQYNNGNSQPPHNNATQYSGQAYLPAQQLSHGPATPYTNDFQGNQQYLNGVQTQNNQQHGNLTHGNQTYGNGGPNEQQNNGIHNKSQIRQDSGYISAGGSYSNSSAVNGAENPQNPQNPQNPHQPPQQMQGNTGANTSVTPQQTSPVDDSPTTKRSRSSSTDSVLSPTSAMLLGSEARPRKLRKGEKAAKRPPPDVADAYSRRWDR
ncbi:hypothetical protein B0J14DRAFT_359287 [Halenospora varia]|nr:hypothetical protein B0J14DRAFT_359287 [Halenospora varia]